MTEDEMNRFIASLSLATPEPEFNVRNLPSQSPYGTIQPDTGMFVGGGGERDVSNEYRNFGISPGFRAGPVSGSATVSTGSDMPTPGVGYSVNAQLPGGFNAGYRRMHAMEAPSRYDQHMLSLAREVLGNNVSGSVTEQDGRRGFGAGVSRPLGGGGNAFINAQRDPRGGHAIMGGMDMRFSRGGYADGGDAEVQSNGMPVISDGQINWGDSSNAADFVRADQATRAMRSAPAAPEPQAAPMPMQRNAPAPAPYSAPRDVPLPPVRPANLGQPVFQNSSPEGPGAYNPDDGFPARPPGQYADPAMLFDPNMMAKGFTPPLEAPSAPPPASPPPPPPPGASDWRRGSFPQEGGGKYTNRAMPLTPPAQAEPLALLPTPTKAVASAAIDQAAPAQAALTRALPAMSPQQRDLIIRTIAAESSGKTPEEGQGIANVILNRIASGRYGRTPEKVLFAPKQFEPWADPRGSNYPMRHKPGTTKYEKAQDALEAAMGGDDITGGATLFWGPKAQAALGRPAPKWGRTGGLDIGETRFHRDNGGMVEEREGHADGKRVISTALEALRASHASRHIADPAQRAANLARFQEGTPASIASQPWYHGSAREVPEFSGNKNTFVTTDPQFANSFAANGAGGHDWDDVHKIWVPRPGSDIAPNVTPFHVRAKNPFDYENPKHIEALNSVLEAKMADPTSDPRIKDMLPWIPRGTWGPIESKPVQDAIRSLGHDAFFVSEDGTKNLALYNPDMQLKSAIGNVGTFDPNIPKITEARGGLVSREHHSGGEAVGGYSEAPPLTIYRGQRPDAEPGPMDASVWSQNPLRHAPSFSYEAPPQSALEQAAHKTDGERVMSMLGAEDLPKGETYASQGPTGIERALSVLPKPGSYLKRQGEAARENWDMMGQGIEDIRNGNYGAGALGLGGGALGYVMSPITGAERVLFRDPYLNATGNLRDAEALEMVADTALTGGLRGPAKMLLGKKSMEQLAAEPWRRMRMPSAATAVGAGAAGMTLAPDEAEAGNFQRVLQSMRAFHGSPYKFDRFDIGKIGTGEGAQAYGHGLYFAEAEPVARGYRDKLSSGTYMTPEGQVFDPAKSLEHLNVRVASQKSLDDAIERAFGLLQTQPENKELISRDLKRLMDAKEAGAAPTAGSMYDVNINANPEYLLDWDSRIAAQPDVSNRINSVLRLTQSERERLPIANVLEMLGTPREASSRLLDAGIPGIKYLDQHSRDAGLGSRNYVIFNDKLIDINRRYAKGGEVEEAASGGSVVDHALMLLSKQGR